MRVATLSPRCGAKPAANKPPFQERTFEGERQALALSHTATSNGIQYNVPLDPHKLTSAT